jgi:hypothetical protein
MFVTEGRANFIAGLPDKATAFQHATDWDEIIGIHA